MRVPYTALSQREILNRLYSRLRDMYGRLLAAQPGDVQADEGILAQMGSMEELMKKLEISFIRKVSSDADYDDKSAQKLAELEKLANEIVRGEKISIRQDHFIMRTARGVRSQIRKAGKRRRKTGIFKLTRIKKEKDKLAKQEKEAKEMLNK